MSVLETIESKLQGALTPLILKVKDNSALHAGHAGAKPEGETHFAVEITAEAFEGMSRVARQRKVYDILKDELNGPVHALELKTSAPSEMAQKDQG